MSERATPDAEAVATWRYLLSDATEPIREAAATCDANDVAAVTRLRKLGPVELINAALDLASARRKAAQKFPQIAPRIVADGVGIEQASSALVADHKVIRFSQLGKPVIDLCSGIGGDSMSFHKTVGVEVAVDMAPLRAWMTQQNVNCPTLCTDVTSLDLHDRIYHFDPARRNARGRQHRFEDYQPGPEFLSQLVRNCPTGATKLGPGIAIENLPDFGDISTELEFISEHGALVQAVLWTGELAKDEHRATLLPTGDSLHGAPGVPPLDQPAQYLYTVDASVERAQLLHVLCDQHNLTAIHPSLGILTGNDLIQSNWLTAFELLAELPWRANKVKQWLNENNAGIVEVKTRGGAVNPDNVQKQLRGKGETPFTVFVLRWDRKLIALITRRPATGAETP